MGADIEYADDRTLPLSLCREGGNINKKINNYTHSPFEKLETLGKAAAKPVKQVVDGVLLRMLWRS